MRTSDAVKKAKKLRKCSNEELMQVGIYARMMAKRKNKPYLADDFASYVFEDLSRQGTLCYNLSWLWANFMRNEAGGNLKNKKGLAKARARDKLSVPVEKASEVVDNKPLPTDEIAWGQMLKALEPPVRASVVLKYKWGMTNREIGEVLGVSGQRIEQILQKAEVPAKRAWIAKAFDRAELNA